MSTDRSMPGMAQKQPRKKDEVTCPTCGKTDHGMSQCPAKAK